MPSEAPKRRHVVRIEVGADTWEEACRAVDGLLFTMQTEGPGGNLSSGPSDRVTEERLLHLAGKAAAATSVTDTLAILKTVARETMLEAAEIASLYSTNACEHIEARARELGGGE